MLKEKIYIEETTSKELLEDLRENPDASYFFDANLSALLENLYYAGFDDDYIITLNNNLYGDYIEFYYLNDINSYALVIGTR